MLVDRYNTISVQHKNCSSGKENPGGRFFVEKSERFVSTFYKVGIYKPLLFASIRVRVPLTACKGYRMFINFDSFFVLRENSRDSILFITLDVRGEDF